MQAHKFSDAMTAMAFMFAGNATITLVSKKTGQRFTYRVQKPKDDDGRDSQVHFVSLLTGPDNERSYSYMGLLRGGRYTSTKKSKIESTAPAATAFAWAWERLAIGRLPDNLEVWHEGTCGRCGRKLTVPTSIASGIGPECAKSSGEPRPSATVVPLRKAQ